jgi:hypothetical protein
MVQSKVGLVDWESQVDRRVGQVCNRLEHARVALVYRYNVPLYKLSKMYI